MTLFLFLFQAHGRSLSFGQTILIDMQKCHVSGVLFSLDNGLQSFTIISSISVLLREQSFNENNLSIVEKTKRESSSNLKAAGVFNLLTALSVGGSHGCSQTFVFRLRSFFVSFCFSQTVRGLF